MTSLKSANEAFPAGEEAGGSASKPKTASVQQTAARKFSRESI